MRTVNTTAGSVEVPRGTHENTGHTLNTSRVVEEDLAYEDEEPPEIIAVLPAGDWHAVVGEQHLPLAAFVALDDGKMHGATVGEDGFIDLLDNVENNPGFTGYTQASNRQQEDK